MGKSLHLLFNACSEDLKFIPSADDSTLYAKGKSLSDLPAKIITELHKVVKWLRINRLSLYVSKKFPQCFPVFPKLIHLLFLLMELLWFTLLLQGFLEY